jgi:hypothetical protein
MTPALGILFGKEILEVRPLQDIEYQKFVIACTELFKFGKKQEYFRLVDANYMEYKTVLNEYLKIHCVNSNIAGTYLEGMIFNINRLVLNFLSAFYILVAHHETYLKKTFGKDSDRFKCFERITNSCFDTYFSYRFLYKLRNYSQHMDMPITGFETSSEIMNLNPLEVNHMLRAIIHKDDLLKYDKWSKVEDEITRLPDTIDINPYIDELMSCSRRINAAFYEKEEFIELLQHTAFLDMLVKEASIKDGYPCVFKQLKDISDTDNCRLNFSEMYRLTYEHFPLTAMELIDLLNIQSNGNPLNK